jgi:hypothetical protein
VGIFEMVQRLALALAVILSGCGGTQQTAQPFPSVNDDFYAGALPEQMTRRLLRDIDKMDDTEGYGRASNAELMDDLAHYCPKDGSPCRQQTPPALLREAARRGLIKFKPSAQRPGINCITIADGEGGGFTSCN